jgi:hypothetical protein
MLAASHFNADCVAAIASEFWPGYRNAAAHAPKPDQEKIVVHATFCLP